MNFDDDLACGRLYHLSHNKKACRILGSVLEVDAEGENIADYVSWALREASDEFEREDALKTLSKLDDKNRPLCWWRKFWRTTKVLLHEGRNHD